MKCKICKGKTKIWIADIFDDRHGYPKKFSIEKCTKCGFAQTRPQISKKGISNLYTKYYPRQNIKASNIKPKDYRQNHRFKLWRKGLTASCHYLITSKADVLDVGCGIPYSLFWLEAQGCNAYGIDPDGNASKIAKKFKLNFHKGFIEDKPFKGKSFDFVLASQVLEHTNNPKNFINECKKRIKPNGKIILSFPNTNSFTRRALGKSWLHWHIPYHLNHFNRKSIEILASECGLKIEKISTVTPNMWTNLQIRRLMQDPKPGIRDTFWDGGDSSKGSFIQNLLTKVYNFLEEYNFVNRLIDLMGMGESFVVILTPKNASENS